MVYLGGNPRKLQRGSGEESRKGRWAQSCWGTWETARTALRAPRGRKLGIDPLSPTFHWQRAAPGAFKPTLECTQSHQSPALGRAPAHVEGTGWATDIDR